MVLALMDISDDAAMLLQEFASLQLVDDTVALSVPLGDQPKSFEPETIPLDDGSGASALFENNVDGMVIDPMLPLAVVPEAAGKILLRVRLMRPDLKMMKLVMIMTMLR